LSREELRALVGWIDRLDGKAHPSARVRWEIILRIWREHGLVDRASMEDLLDHIRDLIVNHIRSCAVRDAEVGAEAAAALKHSDFFRSVWPLIQECRLFAQDDPRIITTREFDATSPPATDAKPETTAYPSDYSKWATLDLHWYFWRCPLEQLADVSRELDRRTRALS
jgi:hypothetical protein